MLLVDPRRITLGFREQVGSGARVIESINPSTLAKSRKSPAELAFVREAMAQDGAAMCAFYAWFDKATAADRPFGAITEVTIDEKLPPPNARKRPGFVGLSFPVIAGYNANGAMPHYRASVESHAVIEGDGLLLIDSGAQYLGGTTDITRVWPIGRITAEHRRDYTRVLQGTLGLSRARFPRGTLSPMLDALARAPLWADKLDYGHGTGHGVGYFLNVHEGPQSISKALTEPAMAMEPGMITSIEPGLYRPGQWGIRIENLVANTAIGANEFGDFLEFETLTLCPIDTRCIEPGMLSKTDVAWLNAYHVRWCANGCCRWSMAKRRRWLLLSGPRHSPAERAAPLAGDHVAHQRLGHRLHGASRPLARRSRRRTARAGGVGRRLHAGPGRRAAGTGGLAPATGARLGIGGRTRAGGCGAHRARAGVRCSDTRRARNAYPSPTSRIRAATRRGSPAPCARTWFFPPPASLA